MMDFGEMPPWLGWPAFFLFTWLWAKAYGFIRDREGTDPNSWLEGFAAFMLGSVLAPFMVIILPIVWMKDRARASAARSESEPARG